MLRCVLISSDPKLSGELVMALSRVPELEVSKVLAKCTSPADLLRTIRVRKINLLIFGLDDLLGSGGLAKSIDDLMPGFPIIATGQRDDAETWRDLMHLGVRDYLTSPIDAAKLCAALDAVRQRLTTHPMAVFRQADVYSFLPAKPGSGTTTIAVSASCALAEELGVRTLLVDADLAAGTIQFLLQLGHTASFVDALMHAGNLDEDLWAQMVGKWDKLEVLHAGLLDPPPPPNPADLQRMLTMARDQYEVVCVDLPSSLDPLSVALMRESRRIMLVTTPEVVSLHMAAARLRRLSELGLDDRVCLLLNRKGKKGFTDAEVASAVGMPISFRFSNDYQEVQDSILKASPLPNDSALGKIVLDLAHSMAPNSEEKETPHRRKFLEFFRVPHEVESDVIWKG